MLEWISDIQALLSGATMIQEPYQGSPESAQSKNQNFQKWTYSKTTDLLEVYIQQDKAQKHNVFSKNAWDVDLIKAASPQN